MPMPSPASNSECIASRTALETHNGILGRNDREAEVEIGRSTRGAFERHVVVQDEVRQHPLQLHRREEPSRTETERFHQSCVVSLALSYSPSVLSAPKGNVIRRCVDILMSSAVASLPDIREAERLKLVGTVVVSRVGVSSMTCEGK